MIPGDPQHHQEQHTADLFESDALFDWRDELETHALDEDWDDPKRGYHNWSGEAVALEGDPNHEPSLEEAVASATRGDDLDSDARRILRRHGREL